jgi:cbb3-type cytochrome oxidase subunit 1
VTATDHMKADQDTAPGPADASLRTGVVVRLYAVTAAAFFVVGVALCALAAAKLVWPDLLADRGVFTYGRVLPAGGDALLFGWLTVGLFGVAMHALPRMSRQQLFSPLAALGALGLLAAGTAFGTAAVLLGHNSGGRWLEFPLAADGVLLAGGFVAAMVLTATAIRGAGRRLPVAGWYLVAGPWWFVLALAAGAVPVFDGLAADVQAAFAGSALFGLWVAAGAIGGAYYVVSAVIPEARFHPRLGPIGFWSIAFAWAWTAARVLQWGPTSDWFETLPVLFGAGLVLAVITIATDFVQALRGRWRDVRGSAALGFVSVGMGVLLVVPVVGFLQSLRSVSSVVGLSEWGAGYDQLILLGAGTLLLIGAMAHTQPAEGGRTMGRWTGRAILWPALLGVVASAGSRLVAGLQQGFAWLAGVQSGTYVNTGDGFAESLRPIRGADVVQAAGLTLTVLAAVGFGLFVVRHAVGHTSGGAPDLAESATAPVASVLRGSFALFVVAALGAFVFPALDSHADPTLAAEASHGAASAAIWDRGQELYVSEGCVYCHTQQVRSIVTDVGLGAISTPGDYAYDTAGVAGSTRLGPDLAHYGARESDSASTLREHLIDPAAAHDWTVMPSYRYLSDDDLAALTAYVSGLE